MKRDKNFWAKDIFFSICVSLIAWVFFVYSYNLTEKLITANHATTIFLITLFLTSMVSMRIIRREKR